jgi:hypothetical protein
VEWRGKRKDGAKGVRKRGGDKEGAATPGAGWNRARGKDRVGGRHGEKGGKRGQDGWGVGRTGKWGDRRRAGG